MGTNGLGRGGKLLMNDHWQRILEILPFSVMAACGWIGHTVLESYKKTGKITMDTRHIIAGILMSGFVAWCVVNLLTITGLPIETCGTVGGIIGASGERAWEALFKKAMKIFGGENG